MSSQPWIWEEVVDMLKAWEPPENIKLEYSVNPTSGLVSIQLATTFCQCWTGGDINPGTSLAGFHAFLDTQAHELLRATLVCNINLHTCFLLKKAVYTCVRGIILAGEMHNVKVRP